MIPLKSRVQGHSIPLECRILAIAIAYSHLVSPLESNKELTSAQALAELNRGAGSQFDPELLEVFTTIMGKDKTAR